MLFRHTISVANRELSMDHAPVHTLPRPFFRNVHHRQIQHFQKGVVRGEDGFRLGYFSELAVEAFDGVRGINQPADGVGKPEIGAQICPVFSPGRGDPGIFLTPDSLKIVQSFQRCRFVCRGVNGLQIRHELLDILIGHILARVAQLVNDAVLDICLRENHVDCG